MKQEFFAMADPVGSSRSSTLLAATRSETVQTWQTSPFPGLRSFRTEEADNFYGRKREAGELIKLFSNPQNRVVTLTGSGGAGKSSLIHAGVLPQLYTGCFRNSERWIQIRMTPAERNGNPFLALSQKLSPLLQRYGSRYHFLPDLLQRQPEEWEKLLEPLFADSPPGTEILLVVDQLEELFTLVPADLRKTFVRLLMSAAKSLRQRILLALHDDYLDHCREWTEFAEVLERRTFHLEPPGFGALFEIISTPAAKAGLTFEPELALRILRDTRDEPQILAKLAFTLAQLWQARTPQGTLTHKAYDDLHGVHNAIDWCVEHILSTLEPVILSALGDIFRTLLHVDEQSRAARRYIPLHQLSANELITRLLKVLLDVGLLALEKQDNKSIVRIAHGSVVYCWPRLNRWVEEFGSDMKLLTQLRHDAAEWERRGRPSRMVWSHEQLLSANAMIERQHPLLRHSEREFALPETNRLLEQLKTPLYDPRKRCDSGDRLAALGDTRPGIGVTAEGVPDLVWCDVPEGRITLEGNKGRFDVKPCRIARYPVTWVQYRSFIDARDGYRNPDWWVGLAGRQVQPGKQWQRLDNHPADNVSWLDGVAFCRWLSNRLGYEVRLPEEWEWQQAATGGHSQFRFPWGSAWQDNHANTLENGLERSLAVGLHPYAAAPTGAMDMSGNVWEWCLNRYDQPEVDKTNLDSYDRRVIRGGSWRSDQPCVTTLFRDLDSPDVRSSDFGFRLLRPGPG
jgi:hypothetical protein